MGEFRVIIVGAGPVGLTMAHCLRLAGVDYVLCEQRAEVEDRSGAGLSVMPHVARLFHQLGVLDEARRHAAPLRTTAHLREDGLGWRDDGPGGLGERFGYPMLLFERYRLIKVLLDALPDREWHVKTGRRVQAIREHADGVVVTFADGSVEEGSIVIGADGVHSGVRRLLAEMGPDDTAGGATIDAVPFTSLYLGLYGHGPRPAALRPGETSEFHHDGWAFQTLTGHDRTFYFIYKKLGTPTKERRRFAEADAGEFVKSYLPERVVGDLTFQDLWEHRDLGNIRLLEQGVSRTWSRGRTVLVGDAAHKVTPNLGVGGNIGMESAACLANHLHALLQRQSAPETASLAQAFRAYQDQRMEAVHFWNETGHRHMQFITLDTPRHRDMFASRIPPFGFDRTTHISYSRTYLRHVSRGVKLDYVPLATELSGSVPWDGGAAAAGGKGAAAGEALRQSPSKL